jgi:hypothetical protein
VIETRSRPDSVTLIGRPGRSPSHGHLRRALPSAQTKTDATGSWIPGPIFKQVSGSRPSEGGLAWFGVGSVAAVDQGLDCSGDLFPMDQLCPNGSRKPPWR